MNKTNKILIGMLLIVILLVSLNRQQSSYPEAWDEIRLGMTKQEVYERIGLPTEETGEWKGGFWIQDRFTQNHVLNIYFENDRALYLSQRRYIGTSQHFLHEQVIRSEYAKR